jgi:hypothetical protein
MHRIDIDVVVVLTLALAGGEGPEQAPEEEYRKLLDAYQKAGGGGASSDAERMKVIARVYRERSRLALEFVELAERHPADPIAVKALGQALWQVNTNPWPIEIVGEDPARARALALLERDHIRSDALGPVCERLSWGFCREYETFLRAVHEKSPHEEVRAQACLALARFLKGQIQRLHLIEGNAELGKEYEGLFGKEYLEDLKRRDRSRVEKEAEALLEQAVEKYAGVKLSDGATVGEKARAELSEMRDLGAGKQAPEIEGEDQDGKRFKLGDYRGKVVLLDFWPEY